jgi:small subunit ribosomal protein S1
MYNFMIENKRLDTQEEAVKPNHSSEEGKELSMAELLESQIFELEPQAGENCKGTIVSIKKDEILVSIGAKSEGVIRDRELESIPEEERNQFADNQEITVYVLATDERGGPIRLSYMRAREEKDWQRAEQMLTSGETFEGKVIGYNKGGLIVPIDSLRGFVPTSQVSVDRRPPQAMDTPMEKHWQKMVGETIRVRVIEVDRERRRLILSERQISQENREASKERLLNEIQIGDIRKGRVTSLAEFGAFVNLDGADGLVHLSEISWEHLAKPSDVLQIGQEVEVKVISVDKEKRRIGLSIRQLLEDPLVKKMKVLRVGQLVEGTITHLTKFGAFARIGDDPDLEGLIHISELSEERIAHPKEVVKEGDKVTLRVIKLEPERKRIGLSLRKVDSAAYADLDWKMELADEIGEVDEEEGEEKSPENEVPVTTPSE